MNRAIPSAVRYENVDPSRDTTFDVQDRLNEHRARCSVSTRQHQYFCVRRGVRSLLGVIALCWAIATRFTWNPTEQTLARRSNGEIDGIVVSPAFLHGGVFHDETDETLVRSSIGVLLSRAKEIRALEANIPILIISDFSVDRASLERFENLRATVWSTRSFRDTGGLLRRLRRACPIGATSKLMRSPYKARTISAHAQSTITRFIFLREALRQIGRYKVRRFTAYVVAEDYR